MKVKKTGDNEYTIYGRKKVTLDELKTIIVGASTLEVDDETAEDLKK